MAIAFLCVAAVLLALALVLAEMQGSKRIDKIKADCDSAIAFNVKTWQKAIEQLQGQLNQHWKTLGDFEKGALQNYSKQAEFNARTGNEISRLTGEIDRLVKEYDTIHIRQRTLEKRIIGTERTVTVVFKGTVPIEDRTPPIIVEKKKRGAGRGALIRESRI